MQLGRGHNTVVAPANPEWEKSRSCSFQLRDSCVDVWRVDLASCEEGLERWQTVLTPDEARRAAGIGSESMRRAFVLARAALRLLLGRYLVLEPGKIQLSCETRGKPVLSGHPETCFSASRSGSVGAFAFCLNTRVGIDLEELRMVPQMQRVIERMFSPCERRQLAGFGPEERQRAFLSCWTRKEAYAKALGDGLLTSFDRFCVDANPEELRPTIHFDEGPAPEEEWCLHDLRLGNAHAAAVAYRGAERTLSIYAAGSVDALSGAN